MSENRLSPFASGPCVIFSMGGASPEGYSLMKHTICGLADAELRGCAVRVYDPFPDAGEAGLEGGLRGPEEVDLRRYAILVNAKLKTTKEVINCVPAQPALASQLHIDIDRGRSMRLGLSTADIYATLQLYLGGIQVGSLEQLDRTVQVELLTDADTRRLAEDLQNVKLRAADGSVIALSKFAKVQTISGRPAIDRFDNYPMLPLYAEPAAGVSRKEAWAACKAAADEVRTELHLSSAYRLVWLSRDPEPK